MAATRTRPTGASVEEYLRSRASPEQLADCRAIMAICARVTKQRAKMWGPSIVGYGSYRYTYESGHSGESCVVAFAIRGDRKSTRLNSSHSQISYAVFCLNKKKLRKFFTTLQFVNSRKLFL